MLRVVDHAEVFLNESISTDLSLVTDGPVLTGIQGHDCLPDMMLELGSALY